MNIEVLLSCMHQKYASIIKDSNLDDIPTLVINQCDIKEQRWAPQTPNLRWLDTPTRGLSVSRNLGILNSKADICIVADDDEIFEDNLLHNIKQGYEKYPQADLIIFTVGNRPDKFGKIARKLRKIELLKVISVRITFRLKSIKSKNILFDPLLGSGTGSTGGEENKFVLDCYKQGLKIYYVPLRIATVRPMKNSRWFSGYNKQFFYNRGKTTRYIYGFWFAGIYAIYFLIFKHHIYSQTISIFQAGKSLFAGIWMNELKHYD